MALSVEELLERRFIVQNLWPNCPFRVDYILVRIPGLTEQRYAPSGWSAPKPSISLDQLLIFPYLIREIKWWEHRKIQDMPQYLKEDNGRFWKVDKWYGKNTLYFKGRGIDGHSVDIYPDGMLPTTEEEFNLFTSKIKSS